SSLSAMLTHIPADVEERMLFSSSSPSADTPVHRVVSAARQAASEGGARVRKAATQAVDRAEAREDQGRVGKALSLIGSGLRTLFFGSKER
ncbi:MAG: hypothetical protein IJI16_01390, partial [Atopobiaceae bacterium]|nr:hypothetical protein [Atopobiaceae bacterium]